MTTHFLRMLCLTIQVIPNRCLPSQCSNCSTITAQMVKLRLSVYLHSRTGLTFANPDLSTPTRSACVLSSALGITSHSTAAGPVGALHTTAPLLYAGSANCSTRAGAPHATTHEKHPHVCDARPQHSCAMQQQGQDPSIPVRNNLLLWQSRVLCTRRINAPQRSQMAQLICPHLTCSTPLSEYSGTASGPLHKLWPAALETSCTVASGWIACLRIALFEGSAIMSGQHTTQGEAPIRLRLYW